jgi:hypothetical protein
MKTVKINGTECTLEFSEYAFGGGTAISLLEVGTGAPYMVASVNLPDVGEGEVAIKNWSENYGIQSVLIESGIIDYPHRFLSSGYIDKIPVCKILV